MFVLKIIKAYGNYIALVMDNNIIIFKGESLQ